MPTATGGSAPMAPTAGGGGEAGDTQFSVTNVQVAGVDEADIVKTDGEYIYQVNKGRVLVIKAYPDNELDFESVLQFDSDFCAQELFLDGKLLVVIGSSIRTVPVEAACVALTPATVKAMVYDVSDASNCKWLRDIEVDGGYVTARKVDHCIYMVARKYPDFYMLPLMGEAQGAVPGAVPGAVQGAAQGAAAPRGAARQARRRNAGLVPAVRDTVKGRRPHRIKPKDVFFFPKFLEPDYIVVAGFDLSEADQPVSVKALLGAGEAVYASREHLYVADSQFLPFRGGPVPMAGTGTAGAVPAAAARDDPQQMTSIYRFDLGGGEVLFSASGKVPGTVLNQFAMDECSGHFRVATTLNDWTTGVSTSNVYVLDGDMSTEGRLEGLAPGEQIFATRFIGDRCYLVTFRMVDPLFVISTADPSAPVVLGQLKIPGFSNYLHPYDDNHILGFGKDAVNGFYQGMKIACFDVTDVNNPIQESFVTIGDRGTDSEVLHDHRALLFDKDRNLLAFPITVAQIANKTPDMPPSTWGNTVFQGAYVYDFSLAGGFVFRKAITHQSPDQAGQYLYDTFIRRLLYIDTNLYSLSDSQVKVNDLGTLDEKRTLVLPP